MALLCAVCIQLRAGYLARHLGPNLTVSIKITCISITPIIVAAHIVDKDVRDVERRVGFTICENLSFAVTSDT